jgi:hypothetical protein
MYSGKLKVGLATIAPREGESLVLANKGGRWMKKREEKDDGLGERGERRRNKEEIRVHTSGFEDEELKGEGRPMDGFLPGSRVSRFANPRLPKFVRILRLVRR